MENLFNKRLLVVWLVLVGITLSYLWIDTSADSGAVLEASTAATIAAICLALVKVRIIMREFMEVRHAPRLFGLLTDGLVVLMGVAMLATYLAGKAVA